MARRQKGPTPEELIQKLQECLDEYKNANDKRIDALKEEQEENSKVTNSQLENINDSLTKSKQENDDKFGENEKLFAPLKLFASSLNFATAIKS